MPHVHLCIELGPSDLVTNLLWCGDMVTCHLGTLVEGSCIYVHADVLVLLLTEGYVEYAVNGLPGINILDNPVLS